MNVRNCWVDADIDGRQSSLSGGPKAKDGGMYLVIRVREKGAINSKKLVVDIRTTIDGNHNSIKASWNDQMVVNEILER